MHKYKAFRNRVFWKICNLAGVRESQILPGWARFVRFLLFPVEMTGYFLTRSNYYDVMTDQYVINGARFSRTMFQMMIDSEMQSKFMFKRRKIDGEDIVVIYQTHID
jgi:hypothetical protein